MLFEGLQGCSYQLSRDICCIHASILQFWKMRPTNQRQEERFETLGTQNHYENKTKKKKRQGKLTYRNSIRHERCSELSLRKYE